jgi:hypothetical protein
VGSLVPVQIASVRKSAGTMPAPKNTSIILHDLEEGCASDLLCYIAHSSYFTICMIGSHARIRASKFRDYFSADVSFV